MGEVDSKKLGTGSEFRVALISVVVSIVSAAATIGAAYLGGFFDVAKTHATSQGSIELERLKFSNELIKGALATTNSANSLLFYADIGLLAGLKADKVKEYAQSESKRLEKGAAGSSLLPSFDKASRPSFWITEDMVAALAPQANPSLAKAIVTTGNYLFIGFGINASAKRLSSFLGQICFETAGFDKIDENANYSKDRLLQLYPSFFDEVTAAEYANKPEKILNRVHANRLGNGAEESGDGYRFRGRGFLFITGRANYDKLANETGIDLIKTPDTMSDPHVALLIAASYWYNREMNALADQDRLSEITKLISGGNSSIGERKRYADLTLKLLTSKSPP